MARGVFAHFKWTYPKNDSGFSEGVNCESLYEYTQSIPNYVHFQLLSQMCMFV